MENVSNLGQSGTYKSCVNNLSIHCQCMVSESPFTFIWEIMPKVPARGDIRNKAG